jgi:hypothetical protein
VANPIDEERAARIRQARQVLAGSEIRPPDDAYGFADRFGLGEFNEFRYFVALAVLVLLAALVGVTLGMGWATPILLILALALIAGWFVL